MWSIYDQEADSPRRGRRGKARSEEQPLAWRSIRGLLHLLFLDYLGGVLAEDGGQRGIFRRRGIRWRGLLASLLCGFRTLALECGVECLLFPTQSGFRAQGG